MNQEKHGTPKVAAPDSVEAMLTTQLDTAKSAVGSLAKELSDHEASVKPLRDKLRDAKVEVERVERALKAYRGNRLKTVKRRAKSSAAAAPEPAEAGKLS